MLLITRSMSKSGIVVRVDLEARDWRPDPRGKGGWECAALRLPGARFSALVGAGGRVVDTAWYTRRGRSITWKGGSNPPELAVELRFASPLMGRLRRAAALGLAMLLGAAITHHFGVDQVLALAQQALAMVGGGISAG